MRQGNLLTPAIFICVLMFYVSPLHAQNSSLDTVTIEKITGIKGKANKGEYKITIPQNDLDVEVDGFKIIPPMGLGTWVAFTPAKEGAMITPGPVVITVGFIGYLVAGFPGACIAALATFLPCYLFTVIPAPYFRKYGKNASIKAVVDGVTAAAVGAIAGAVIVLARRQFTDLPSVFIALATIFVLVRFKKIPEPVIILAAALIGLLIKNWLS